MKFFTKNSKKILIAILLVMSFNFISPTISQADFGGALFAPIAELLKALADLVISGLQEELLGDGSIYIEGIRKSWKG